MIARIIRDTLSILVILKLRVEFLRYPCSQRSELPPRGSESFSRSSGEPSAYKAVKNRSETSAKLRANIEGTPKATRTTVTTTTTTAPTMSESSGGWVCPLQDDAEDETLIMLKKEKSRFLVTSELTDLEHKKPIEEETEEDKKARIKERKFRNRKLGREIFNVCTMWTVAYTLRQQ